MRNGGESEERRWRRELDARRSRETRNRTPRAPSTLPSVLVADPPWSFGDALPGPTRGASRNYATMSVGQICGFRLPALAPSSILFLWRVAAMQREALDVVRAWGFTVKSDLVWLKTTSSGKEHFGMGRYVRASHETCLIATRGGAFEVGDRAVRSVFSAPTHAHSGKPTAFYEIVEKLTPGCGRVELFARRKRPGWKCYGNQVEE